MADLAPSCENRSSRLEDLTAQATARYSTKDYDAAAELYAHATELQADINGEMSMHNADLLYAYGRCLFHVAIKNSDVLGTRVIEGKPAESPVKPLNRKRLSIIAKPHNDDKGPAEEELLKVVEESNGATKAHSNTNTPSKPYFQFAGDENFDISEDDVDESEFMDGEESEEEEDDFANAFEVLDLARVLLQQRIQDVEQRSDKSKNKGDSSATKSQELLADVYDLQAEISLEGERFPDAATDLKSALELKMTLYPKESSIIAEAHYKLALALEFSSMTQHTDDHGELNDGKVAPVDFKLREEAVTQMEAAIASCKVRIGNEQERLQISSQTGGEDNESNTSSKDIEEVKGLVIEMEQRVNEHRIVNLELSLTFL